MKKVSITVATIGMILLPLMANAMVPGYQGSNRTSGNGPCTVWREGVDPAAPGLCNNERDQTQRLYDLETEVSTLEDQTNRLQAKIDAQQAVVATPAPMVVTKPDPRVDAVVARVGDVEKRVGVLETTVTYLTTTLTRAITNIVGMLQKLLK